MGASPRLHQKSSQEKTHACNYTTLSESLRYLLLLALAAESFNFVYLLVQEAVGAQVARGRTSRYLSLEASGHHS